MNYNVIIYKKEVENINLSRLQKLNKDELIKEIEKLDIDAKRRRTNNRRLRQRIKNLIEYQKGGNIIAFKKECPDCGEFTYSAGRNINYCVECGADIRNIKAVSAGVGDNEGIPEKED